MCLGETLRPLRRFAVKALSITAEHAEHAERGRTTAEAALGMGTIMVLGIWGAVAVTNSARSVFWESA